MRNAFGLFFTILIAPVAFSGNALAQILPNYEILPASGGSGYGVPSPAVAGAAYPVFVEGGWRAWKVDRVNNKISLCSVSVVFPVPPPPPTPYPPGPVTPLVPANTIGGQGKLTPNPTCNKYAAFSGNA